jgi:16S rRNA (guanine966-N2)-methyltransferase
MSLKILGGLAKGFTVDLPATISFKPTSVMLRRRVFDKFQHWEDVTFLDICGGSGIMGLEALSRGASSLIYVDKNRESIHLFKKQLELFKARMEKIDPLYFKERSIIIASKDILQLSHWIEEYSIPKRVSSTSRQFYFIDPPYHDKSCYEAVLQWLEKKRTSPLVLTGAPDDGNQIERNSSVFCLEYHQKIMKTLPQFQRIMESPNEKMKCEILRAGDRELFIQNL